jgi:DNA-directed RNA polymerase subunit M/transcription elongation factor TFIIS
MTIKGTEALSRGMKLEAVLLPVSADGNCPNCGFPTANYFAIKWRDAERVVKRELFAICQQCGQPFLNKGGSIYQRMQARGLVD